MRGQGRPGVGNCLTLGVGNYVIPPLGNYLTLKGLRLGNYLIADTQQAHELREHLDEAVEQFGVWAENARAVVKEQGVEYPQWLYDLAGDDR